MDEKLDKLYNECIAELNLIGIDILGINPGNIDIKISKRKAKRYGCCKYENPIQESMIKIRKGRKIFIQYSKFKTYHIEISKWVMDLDETIIKNTIMHELIHCIPNCNDHGKQFKEYANYINRRLGYNITRVGNKAEDYKKSNIEFENYDKQYNYKITCTKCGIVSYRQRMTKYFTLKYRCAKCRGALMVENLKK